MENLVEWAFLGVVICFWIVFYINQKQRAYIKRIETLAENWVCILKERDEMIKNGTWDGGQGEPKVTKPNTEIKAVNKDRIY